MDSRIAIIMATFNGASWIDEQITSIRAQSHSNWHLFVRDDGSTDSTIEIIQSLLSPEQVTFIDVAGKSTGSPAGNFFAALCCFDNTGFDFVALADQDDIWVPNKLRRALECMRAEGAQCYSSDLVAFDNYSHRAWYIHKGQPSRKFDYLFQGASAGCSYVLSCEAVKLIIEKVRPYVATFPKQRSHDWLIYAICRSYGLIWLADETASIFYRQHSQNAFGAMPSLKGLLSRLKLSREHWYREHVKWLANFLKMSPEEHEIISSVERLSILDRFHLVRQAKHFRRKLRDQWLFAIAVLTGSF